MSSTFGTAVGSGQDVPILHMQMNQDKPSSTSYGSEGHMMFSSAFSEISANDLGSLDLTVVDNTKPGSVRETWGDKVEFLLTCVAFAVGLGNVWRFPYLCFTNGGGAFLIPYVIMLALLGLPLFYLELALGQYASLGPISIWRLSPLFKGIGYTQMAISFMVSIYYNVIIGWTLYYLFASFTTELPWKHCNNTWNTEFCRESGTDVVTIFHETTNTSNEANNTSELSPTASMNSNDGLRPHTNYSATSPAEEYWHREVLQLSDGLEHIGSIRWHLALCLLLAWIIVYCCIVKGIRSSGKVVYFTATFPYFVLFAMFIRGVTLPGAAEGIKFYLKPDFKKMLHAKVWKDAAVQILYSLGAGSGALLAMSSYNKFNNNCYKDAILVSLINCGTSVFAGFVIFSVLGFMAHTNDKDVAHVVKDGPGLAFIVYPEALALMSGSSFWSICFFFMLFILGLGSQFPGIECISTAFVDEFPILRKYKPLFTLAIVTCMFLLGLPCVTQGGSYVIELLDKYATSFPLLFVTMFECLVISWVYGFRRFSKDVELMIGSSPNRFWLSCWSIITPLLAFVVIIATSVEYDGAHFQGYDFPTWGNAIGWLFVAFALSMIPIWMIIKTAQVIGSWENLRWVLLGPKSIKELKLQSLIQPTESWGPALSENRTQQGHSDATSRTDQQKIVDCDELAETNPESDHPTLTTSTVQLKHKEFNPDSYI